jgi:hypothetical protein
MQNFGDVIWIVFCIHVLAVYVLVLSRFLKDLVGDVELNGWFKAMWIVALIFVPFLTALIYLITRGRGMADREVGGDGSAAMSTSDLKALRESGAITQAEFNTLKAHR